LDATALDILSAFGSVVAILVSAFALFYTRKAAATAKNALGFEEATYRESRTARPELVGPVTVTPATRNRATFSFPIYNPGPAAATRVRVRLHWPERTRPLDWWPGGTVLAESRQPLFSLNPLAEPSELVLTVDPAWDHADGFMPLEIVYEDGNGSHERMFWFSIIGEWERMQTPAIFKEEPSQRFCEFSMPMESKSRAYERRQEPDN
jgi:hypothetical protein